MKKGFVYIWYDNLRKMFYIGSHWGRTDDGYLCSNDRLYNAIKKRPENFKRKIIEHNIQDKKILLEREQHWLNMIKDEELSSVSSVTSNTAKYYNYKKFATGGNGGANKGKNKTAWNKGITSEMLDLRRNKLFSLIIDKPIKKKKTILIDKRCPICNNIFSTNNKQKIFCSKECSYLNRNPNYKPKNKKETIIIKCENCGKETTNKSFCSLSCNGSYQMKTGKSKPGFIKGQTAWNKGLTNPQSALNGKNGAKKQSETVKGRRKKYTTDSTWIWCYTNNKE